MPPHPRLCSTENIGTITIVGAALAGYPFKYMTNIQYCLDVNIKLVGVAPARHPV